MSNKKTIELNPKEDILKEIHNAKTAFNDSKIIETKKHKG